MTGFYKNKGISRVVLIFAEEGRFRSTRSFSQQNAIFAAHFAAVKWGELCCEMALVCQEGASRLLNFSQRGAWGCEMISQQSGDFAAKWRFRNELVGAAKWFHSKGPISQRLLLGCEISQTPVFTLFLAPNDFSSFLLQFLLILIIQKPILHQIKLELKHWNQN